MCGIFGSINNAEPITPHRSESPDNSLWDAYIGLSRLEYRGYDSFGYAALKNGEVTVVKQLGSVDESAFHGECEKAIGHVRWATHGIPSQANAHPHSSEEVSVVHNGIIENSNELKKDLEKKGYKFKSQTDTEVITFLLTDFLKDFDLVDAINKTLKTLNGSFALGILFKKFNNIVVGARRGSPLAVGYGPEENYLGSDSYALKVSTKPHSKIRDKAPRASS